MAERTAWQRWGWLLRWLGTIAGIAYIATLIEPGEVQAAFGKISPAAWLAAIALVGVNVVIGAGVVPVDEVAEALSDLYKGGDQSRVGQD